MIYLYFKNGDNLAKQLRRQSFKVYALLTTSTDRGAVRNEEAIEVIFEAS